MSSLATPSGPYIVPAKIEHAGYIAMHVREPDERELWVSCLMKPLDALLRGLDRSDQPLTGFAGGVPVCMWGVVPESFIGNIGVPWMVGTEKLDEYALPFLRRCRNQVMEMLFKYDMLQNYVDARNTRSIQWLKWLGFSMDEKPEPYGVYRLPFYRFVLRKDGYDRGL